MTTLVRWTALYSVNLQKYPKVCMSIIKSRIPSCHIKNDLLKHLKIFIGNIPTISHDLFSAISLREKAALVSSDCIANLGIRKTRRSVRRRFVSEK